jgi:hypothetical protein
MRKNNSTIIGASDGANKPGFLVEVLIPFEIASVDFEDTTSPFLT